MIDPLTTALLAAAEVVDQHVGEIQERAVDPLVPVHERATALVELGKVGAKLARVAKHLLPVHQLPVVPHCDSGLYGVPPGGES